MTTGAPGGDELLTWAFAPASVSNVACGFDVVGFALDSDLGDWVGVRDASAAGVVVESIVGDDGSLPRAVNRNTAGRAVEAVLELVTKRLEESGSRLLQSRGLAVRIVKQMPISSGIGSSAASAAAAAAAANAHLGDHLAADDVLACALEGELIASGSRHADNVAPALYGGLLAVRSLDPTPDIVQLPCPRELSCALVLPALEVSTHAARAALGSHVELRAAVQQSANLAALVHALHTDDFDLLSRSLVDCIAEPKRKSAVTGFAEAMAAARRAGALGGSLSGSGPALFALCREHSPDTEDTPLARSVAAAMSDALGAQGIECRRLACRPAAGGALHSAAERSAPESEPAGSSARRPAPA